MTDYKYNCEECNYRCKYESLWKQHMSSKKHQNQDRKQRSDKVLVEQCSMCSFIANNLTNMKVHRLTKHSKPEERKNEFKFYCDKCDFGTFVEILFSRHLETKKHILEYPMVNNQPVGLNGV
jgi:ribosomal protein L35